MKNTWFSPERPTDSGTVYVKPDGEETPEQLRQRARDLYRRSDNVPLSRDGSGVARVGDLREEADRLMARADERDAS